MYYFFFVPTGTDLPVRKFPATVASLAFLNIFWFLIFHYSPAHAARMTALAFDAENPRLLTAFSACFLHSDWFHLLGNLLYLATFGPALEDRIGSRPFLLLYLACGFCGMATQAEFHRLGLDGGSAPMVLGASAAIAGILGLFVVRCGFARVRVARLTMALVQGQARAGQTPLNAVVAIGAWVLLQAVYGLVASGGVRVPTAYASHLGGFGAGLVLGLALGYRVNGRLEALWTRTRRRARAGEHFAALGDLLVYLRDRPRDAEAWLEGGRLHRLIRRPREAVRSYYRGIFLLWLDGRRDRAVEAAREMRRHYPAARLKPSLLYRLALYEERSGDLGWASHTFEDYSRFYPSHERAPRALLKAARLEARHRNDLPRALSLYETLVERYPDSAEGRDGARELEAARRVLVHRSLPPPGDDRAA